jgi:hypothetical protein
MVFAGISRDKARRIFERMTKRRPHHPATDAGVGAMAEGLTASTVMPRNYLAVFRAKRGIV